MTQDLHAKPIDAIRTALTNDFQEAAALREQLRRSPNDASTSVKLEGTLSKVLSSIDTTTAYAAYSMVSHK